MTRRDETEVLRRLRDGGARRLRAVRFRRNRRTIWSLTRHGTVLNLHEAYRGAPWSVLDAFAAIARLAPTPEGRRGAEYGRATGRVRAWPGLAPALRRIRSEHRRRTRRRAPRSRATSLRPGPCCASPEQRAYLRTLYRHLNHARFGGRLPADVHVRLSSRMRSRLGQMRGGVVDGRRVVVEIALNEDLMLEGNGSERLETLLHEMAHVADWLESGAVGHGPGWRAWARRAGCADRACTRATIHRRADRRRRVGRVPPPPPEPTRGPDRPVPGDS